MIVWTGPAPWEFEFPHPGGLTSTFLAGVGANARERGMGAGAYAGVCAVPKP